MAKKSSFDEEAKKKAIDKAMPAKPTMEGDTLVMPPMEVGGVPPKKKERPKKGSVKHIAGKLGNIAARGLHKVATAPTPVDAAITAGKSFKETFKNQSKRGLEQEHPRLAEQVKKEQGK